MAYINLLNTRLLPLRFSDAAKVLGPPVRTATNWWAEPEGNAPLPGEIISREAALQKDGAATDIYASRPKGRCDGPQLTDYPADLVLPLFASTGQCGGPMMICISGIHSSNPKENHNHTDLYDAGGLGYIELYSQNNGERVQLALIYFRSNAQFVPLKSTSDFPQRLEWEKAKFAALTQWLENHLPPMTDLGELAISKTKLTSVDLGGGTKCELRYEKSFPTNSHFTICITSPKHPSLLDASYLSFQSPAEAAGFCVDGKYYRFVPVLSE
jgi:hypothetical protein